MKTLYGELGAALMMSQRCHPEKLLEAGFRFRHPNLAETLNSIYC
jgi:NAD dependent epimerase/dehydratase family enzyme